MKIAISADCFNTFTSGFPVRGMMMELIKMHPNDLFILFYTKRPTPIQLKDFYEEINNLPNVEVRYFNYGQKVIGIFRMLLMSNYIQLDCTFDCFINPGYLEYIHHYTGHQIATVTDLSILKGQSSISYPFFWKWQNKISKPYFFRKKMDIVAISNYTQNDIEQTFNNIQCNITIIYNGIDNFWFDNKYEENDIVLSLKDTDYFIWWGIISRRKNIDNLVKAYCLAKKDNPNIPKLLLVGGVAEHMNHIKAAFNKDVINIPFQSDYVLKSLVRNSRGLIFPSFYEGFGLPVIEAFSQGIPVACSNVTSLPEIADNKALLFDPNNVNEIKLGIIQLGQTKKQQDVLKQYASDFTYKKAALAYNAIINNLTTI